MNKKELKQRSKIMKDIVELSNNDAPKLLQLCKDDECYETLKKKFEELGYYYNTARYNLMQSSLNALEMPKHTSDTSAAIKGQIIGGTSGAIISYEKNKEAREKYYKNANEFYKHDNEYDNNWSLAVKTYNEILDILNSNKKCQLYFAQKKQKQEEVKKNQWETKVKYLSIISLVLSVIIAIFVSIIVHNNIKTEHAYMSTGSNIFFTILAFLVALITSFVFIAVVSNALFDKIKK